MVDNPAGRTPQYFAWWAAANAALAVRLGSSRQRKSELPRGRSDWSPTCSPWGSPSRASLPPRNFEDRRTSEVARRRHPAERRQIRWFAVQQPHEGTASLRLLPPPCPRAGSGCSWPPGGCTCRSGSTPATGRRLPSASPARGGRAGSGGTCDAHRDPWHLPFGPRSCDVQRLPHPTPSEPPRPVIALEPGPWQHVTRSG